MAKERGAGCRVQGAGRTGAREQGSKGARQQGSKGARVEGQGARGKGKGVRMQGCEGARDAPDLSPGFVTLHGGGAPPFTAGGSW
ncbi:MAG: hypothetical protein FJ149_02135 [Euryarchaeota archaeon]|nr:hypothetical protein [Euryarchaeota archaeon]